MMGRLLFLLFLFHPVVSVRSDIDLNPLPNHSNYENFPGIFTVNHDTMHTDTTELKDLHSKTEVRFPLGYISFADSVILYDPGAMGEGTGDEPDNLYQDPEQALGPPDHKENPHIYFVSLGKGGTLVLQFIDNVLIDGEGPDIHIQFADDDTEEVKVWISQDGETFRYTGKASSYNPNIDISHVTEQGDFFSYIKIRDEVFQGELESPRIGADIDAVGALYTAARFVFSTSSLFQNNLEIRESTESVLSKAIRLIQSLPNPLVLIHVFTDNRGSADLNLIRSQAQADALHYYFFKSLELNHGRYSVIGWGESNPIDLQNQEKNNRVEIFILIE